MHSLWFHERTPESLKNAADQAALRTDAHNPYHCSKNWLLADKMAISFQIDNMSREVPYCSHIKITQCHMGGALPCGALPIRSAPPPHTHTYCILKQCQVVSMMMKLSTYSIYISQCEVVHVELLGHIQGCMHHHCCLAGIARTVQHIGQTDQRHILLHSVRGSKVVGSDWHWTLDQSGWELHRKILVLTKEPHLISPQALSSAFISDVPFLLETKSSGKEWADTQAFYCCGCTVVESFVKLSQSTRMVDWTQGAWRQGPPVASN